MDIINSVKSIFHHQSYEILFYFIPVKLASRLYLYRTKSRRSFIVFETMYFERDESCINCSIHSLYVFNMVDKKRVKTSR